MAKNKKEAAPSSSGSEGRAYLVAGIILAVFGAIILLLNLQTAASTQRYQRASSMSMDLLTSMNDDLRKVNENVLEIVGGVGTTTTNTNEITLYFDSIEDREKDFESLEFHSDEEMRRYTHAKTFISAYRTKLQQFQLLLGQGQLDATTMRALYTQEVSPIAFTSSEMLEAAISLNTINQQNLSRRVIQLSIITNAIIVGLVILGEIAIIIFSRVAKRRREELEKKTKQAEAAASKFKHSQQKVSEIAFTNILTNMKNRYALDNDIGERLDTDTFNIAVFDMDNFKIINDTYGYDFGDEYLAQIAERLKQEYTQYAEIYNIQGNCFAFVFNKDVSDVQATRLAQNILMSMSDVYTVANLAIQLTCSGCIYHYIAGDCQNLSGLLVKMDNVIRNAKRSGGNAVFTVDSI